MSGAQLERPADEDDPGADETVAIYLAGPVGHLPDGGAEWRNSVVEFWGDDYEFHDPLAKYNIPAEDLTVVDGRSNPENPGTVGVEEIVEGDLELLWESDGVLVGYEAVRSIGTPMEVMWARERDYPVAIWVRDDTEFGDLSPWYQYHATAITTDPEMGLRHIERYVTQPEVFADA